MTRRKESSSANQSRDAVLLRMLKTPPTPHKPIGKKAKAALEKGERNEIPTDEELRALAEAAGQNIPESTKKPGK